ncbi:DUF445 domain-containing protein [Halorientalis brevis]|uniref:DUF445 domain-containing protein n=1 Tax=Halorientalis brevis TaxID=1126241 RepID=A0ABD6C7S0_9EURY|nr:hypothetical protein [Halorientalis brevis]
MSEVLPVELGLFAVLGSGLSVSHLLAGPVSLPGDLASIVPSGINWSLVLIPPITGIIGYVTNWVGIRLLFHPVDFFGVKVPGMQQVASLLPTKIQQIPGVREGKLGWQGIVPSRAAKMGSLAADNGVTKIASQKEFYEQFDPETIAEHVVAAASDDIHRLVDDIIRREHPQLWRDAPPAVREMIHSRVESSMPAVVDRVFHDIGENIDDLMDMKMMMVNKLGNDPELLNKMFLEIGDRELKFLINSGFFLGTFLGIFSIPLFIYIGEWWVLPVAGTLVGYFTNFIAIKAIFNPKQPVKVGPFTVQGLFIKRQNEAAETYSELVAGEIVTVGNIAENMLNGSKSDRTRKMITDALRPAVDEAVGVAGPLVRVTTGDREYEAIRESFANETIEYAFEPLKDPTFNRRRSGPVQELIARRMKELPPEDYCVMLRSAFKEDEWLLIGIGAVLGFVAGWIQLLVVTAL